MSNPDGSVEKGGRTVNISKTFKREHEKYIKKLTDAARAFEKSNREQVRIIRDALHRIDFRLLESIIRKHAEKSGVVERIFNWPNPSDITIIPGRLEGREGAAAFYDGVSNRIFITPDAFEVRMRQLKEGRREAEALLTAEVLFVVAHEYVRASGFHLIDEFKTEEADTHKEIQHVSGYAIAVQGVDKKYRPQWMGFLFKLLNDGVVTRIKDQVVSEYIHQGGTPNLRHSVLSLHVYYQNAPWRYILAAEVVQDIVEKMSSTLDLPEKVVWNAFVAGYFAGSNLLDEEYGKAVVDTLGEEIFKKLTITDVHDTDEEMRNLQSQIRAGLPPITHEIAERWIRTIYPEIESHAGR